MICKIFYRKVTGDVEKMRISKKEEKKCKIVETEKTKESPYKPLLPPQSTVSLSSSHPWLPTFLPGQDQRYCKNSRSECNNCIECDPWKNGKSIKKDEKKDRGDPG